MSDSLHILWGQTNPASDMDAEIACGIRGHSQVADAMLLDLAIRNGGVLATFDRRLHGLLAARSTLREAIELVPA